MSTSRELSERLRLRPLAEAARELEHGRVTSVSLTEACLSAAERIQDSTNAFIDLRPDQALRQAARADRARAEGQGGGPLLGIPLAHKDIFFRAGEITTAGSALLGDNRATATAEVLERLDSAGAVDIGTLNLAEFCVGPTGQNDHSGDCRNPWNPARISGGSSSGSGAAVASRAVFGSIGSDTGGSIRLPAGMCGVVGLKPSRGLVSLRGGVERCWSLDVFGPLARTVEDVALLLGVIAGYDPADPQSRSVEIPDYHAACLEKAEAVSVGVPVGLFDTLDDDIAACHRAALDDLRAAGCALVDVALGDTAGYYSATTVINDVEATFLHRENLARAPELYNKSTLWRINRGHATGALDYVAALRGQDEGRARFLAEVLGQHDAIYLPLLEIDVPDLESVRFFDTSGADRVVPRLTRWSRWVSYLGLPSLALPIGMSSAGLPVACQLVGGMFRESDILGIGHRYQARTRWHEQAPPISGSVP